MTSINETIWISSDNDGDSSGSEFEDPDKTEVPGGGKDLASARKTAVTSTSKGNSNGKTAVTSTSKIESYGKQENQMLIDLIEKDSESEKSDSISTSLFNFNNKDKRKNANFTTAGVLHHMLNNNVMNGPLGSLPNNVLPQVGMDAKQQLFNQLRSVLGMSAKNPHLMNTYADMLQNMMVDPNNPYLRNLLWQNNANFNQLKGANQKLLLNAATAAAPVEEEDDDEEMGVAETYADYKPRKLNLKHYVKHPDPVVETASLSSVEPADVTYKLSLPEETIKQGTLSALQLESITYAAQKHESFLPDGNRAGFLIGDGAGVGKGRTIAGLIFENYQKGRKRSIWISVSTDLKYDSERDLNDIGASKIKVYALNKLKYAKISSPENGNIKKGVIFSTYSSLIGESTNVGGKFKSRLNMLIQWFGDDFDGLIVFDECHRAKNLCPVGSSKPTKTGLTVLDLQKKLPKARIVYASATGASEPKNMAYMIRLGMWGGGTPFPEFTDFIAAVEKRGVGAMEIVAMDMKLRGMYIARQLSFQGVTFRIENVPIDKKFIKMYDDAVRLWAKLLIKFQEAAELIGAEGRLKKTVFCQFWASHQRFFKYLCIASKVSTAVSIAHDAVKCGKCVVIGLQSTGEARTIEQLDRDDGELNDFVSTAKGVLQSLVENHFPAPQRTKVSKIYGCTVKKPTLKTTLKSASCSNIISSKKRKAGRNANNKLSTKKQKIGSSSDSSFTDSDTAGSSGSEYKDSDDSRSVSGSNSSSEDYESEASSSFVVSDSSSEESSNDSEFSDVSTKPKKKKNKPKLKSKDKFFDYLLTKKKEGETAAKKNSVKPMTNGYIPPVDAVLKACSMKEELLAEIEKLGERLPPNALDKLIDDLGGAENVAEMTGRKGRVVQTEDGIQYESRSETDVPLETLNLTEKQRFMDGEKDIAIISEAASSGISLQSDRRVKNQRRRVHITLELPWSADRAIQQFGRTHRSNQVNAPEYIFLISNLAGEKRFASTVAKRLESLGALTHGDRRATETRDLSQFNIDNKYGRSALEAVMKSIMKYEQPIIKPPSDYKGDFFKDIADGLVGVGMITNSESSPGTLSFDKDYNNISKFLNRILGMPVDLQNRLFKYFQDTLNAIILKEKRLGRFDLGILDLGMSGEDVRRIKLHKFLRKHSTGIAPTELHIVQVERGMSWKDAKEKENTLIGSKEGFYLSHQVRNNKITAILAVAADSSLSANKQSFYLYRPNTGLQVRLETVKELEGKYRKVNSDEAEKPWTEQYESSSTTCSHAYWRGNCRNMALLNSCEVGLRRRTYNILSGSVLAVWSRIEAVVATRSLSNNKMQVVRLKIGDNVRIVGTLIPKNCVAEVISTLSKDAENTEEITF